MSPYEFDPKRSYCVQMWLDRVPGAAISADMLSPGRIAHFEEGSTQQTPADRDWDVSLPSGRFCLILTWAQKEERWFAVVWADPDSETRATVDEIVDRLVARGGELIDRIPPRAAT